jgi:IS5 family transposase
MQGFSDPQRELLDADSVTGHLLPAGSVFAFLAQQRLVLFPTEMFTDLFLSGRGRPSVAPDVVASVLVLQALHGLSDRQAADAVTFDLRWKAACGLAVTDTSFHATTLTYWRRRLAASKSPDRIFDAVRSVIEQTGVIRGKTRRVLDSTVLDDAVATQDTVTQLVAAIRRVLRVVPGALAVLEGRETACDYTQPGKPDIAWDDKAAKAALVHALVLDALTLLDALTSTDADADAGIVGDSDDDDGDGPVRSDEAEQALALLALLAGQDVEWLDDGAGGGVWRIARKVAHDRVISTVDTETRHAHKSRSRKQDGFKAHIAAEPDTGLITNTALTRATGEGTGDAAAGAVVLAGDDSFTEPGQVLADSAYGTGELLNELQEAGHDPVIKPWPCTPNIPGGFGVDDFTVDHQVRVVTCPAGNTASFSGKSRTAKFGTACAACPFRDRCTTAVAGRSVTVNVHDQIQRAHRVRWNTDPQMRADYKKHRPMVERSIAWLTRGARRLRYRGVAKNDAWLKLRASGINLRQLCTTGLTRTPGGWQIAT